GFDKTAGMTLKPSRKILARVREVSGLLHPREHIHVIAPGDPIFQSGTEASITPTRRTRTGSQSDRYLNQPPPNVIVTSQRILVRQESRDDVMWVSHFYCDMLDEAPAILSWV